MKTTDEVRAHGKAELSDIAAQALLGLVWSVLFVVLLFPGAILFALYEVGGLARAMLSDFLAERQEAVKNAPDRTELPYVAEQYGTPCEPCGGRPFLGPHVHCPKCGSAPDRHEVRNYSQMWQDGDVHCLDCGTYVRVYDAG